MRVTEGGFGVRKPFHSIAGARSTISQTLTIHVKHHDETHFHHIELSRAASIIARAPAHDLIFWYGT